MRWLAAFFYFALAVTLVSMGCKAHSSENTSDSTPTMIPDFPNEAALLSSILADSEAQSTVLVTPFLQRTVVQRIERRLRTRPVVHYFSTGPDGKVLNLTGDVLKLQAAALEDGMALKDAEAARGYVALAFQVAKSRKGYLVASPADIRWLPEMSEGEAGRRDRVLANHAQALQPLHAEPDGLGFRVRYHCVLDRELLLVDVAVQANGMLRESLTVLEKELPVVWVQ